MVCEGLLGKDLEGNSRGVTEVTFQNLSGYKMKSSDRILCTLANIRPRNIPNFCTNVVPLHQPGR